MFLSNTTTPNFVAIDTETTGLNPWRGDRMFAAAAVFPNGRILFWRDEFSGLREVLADEAVDKVFHNATFDLRMLEFSGFRIRGNVWDTVILTHLADGRQSLKLEDVSKRYLPSHRRKVSTELTDWFKEHKILKAQQGKHFADLPSELLKKRCVGDATLTALLFMRLYPVIKGEFPLLLKQEHRLIPIVKKMEDRGLLVDLNEIKSQQVYLTEVVKDVTYFCEDVVGWEGFNLNSHDHQEELLAMAGVLEHIKEKTKKTRKPKLSKEVLKDLHHPVASMLAMGKQASDLSSKFLNQVLNFQVDSILHPNWHQAGTLSGRFSTSKPNILNIPEEGGHLSETEAEEALEFTGEDFAPHIKRCFICRPGYSHLNSDKAKLEVVMLAHYTADPTLLAILKSGHDIHSEISERMFDSKDKGLRVRAKAVVFGFMYGAGDERIAINCKCSLTEAKEYRRRLQQVFPGLSKWNRDLQRQLQDRGFIRTAHGRRHYLDREESYMAVNRMCQGTGADEVKSRMIAVDDWLNSNYPDGTIILNYHDALTIETPTELIPEMAPKFHELMEETSISFRAALPSSLEVTHTRWSDLQEYKNETQQS